MSCFSLLLSVVALLSAPGLGDAVSLAQLGLDKVLAEAAPIAGEYVHTRGGTAEWMKAYPDSTPLVHMNIPGTHDSTTWNYTQAAQDTLLGITRDINHVTVAPPAVYRCQDRSLLAMLDAGIRALDLRYALDATNSTLVFYHSQALLSQTATAHDVLFALYRWLADHPSETLFLSLQYEGSTAAHASNSAAVQHALYGLLTDAAARRFFVQQPVDRLADCLGSVRGQITLLRRFDLDQLDPAYEAALPGLHFSPNNWTDNGVDIRLVYNTQHNLTAYIEDYYEPNLSLLSSSSSSSASALPTAETSIRAKYNATVAHLDMAALPQYRDSLFWTWASSENVNAVPAVTPEMAALGNGSAYTPAGGVNHRLVSDLRRLKGKRLGIVMFDYYKEPSELLEAFLDL